MEAYIIEWLSILVRWIHVIAAIAWIGHAFLFHTFEHNLRKPEVDDVDPNVKGELWMVHGGGFFRLQKTRVLPGKYTGELVWFKWEAAFTWMSGFVLLIIVFYLGGGIYLVDPVGPGVEGIAPGMAMAIGLGSLIVGWALYDLLWSSPLGKRPAMAGALTVALIVGAILLYTRFLSHRAAYIHVGALLGTIMVANVWMRILPNTRRMLAALERGEEPDLGRGAIGKERSLHNGYMHFPVIFIMISNHFPSTYGHEQSWLILIALMALGAAMRQVLYDGLRRTHVAVKLVLAASVALLVYLTLPSRPDAGAKVMEPAQPSAGKPIDPATTGTIRGEILFQGQAPAARELTLLGGCENLTRTPPIDDSVVVKDGKLANVFVWIREGHEPWAIPPAPTTEVVVDQHACIYSPHVVGVRVGQPITFVNSDPLFHNVRSVAQANEAFNLYMAARNERITRTFKRPEIMIQTRCDVHPWMRSYIGVVPHPWFAVTGSDGAFVLQGVPPGQYVVEAWHEVFGKQSQTVTVGPAAETSLGFSFSP